MEFFLYVYRRLSMIFFIKHNYTTVECSVCLVDCKLMFKNTALTADHYAMSEQCEIAFKRIVGEDFQHDIRQLDGQP